MSKMGVTQLNPPPPRRIHREGRGQNEQIGSEAAKTPEPANGGLSHSVKQHLQAYFRTHENGLPAAGLYERVLKEVERPLITLTLQATRGNQVRAADVLGINRNTLRKKIRELGISITRGER